MDFQINTPDEAIDALGGTTKTARFFGIENERVVSNWRKRGLPPETFKAFTEELTRLGRTADPALWRQRVAAQAAE